ncbi:coiled-coil protein [Perilla frutescens var. hirtella]|nr:coiled-coil protein [Perilla frutescens var. frutescens]KAH6776127.1 coiled-coil protein [Perilla frutescens var. hirtella]
MSFLAGRSAAKEGSYFLQESKQAVARILEKHKNSATNVVKPIAENTEISSSPSPDVLPEILRHSLPSKIFSSESESLGSSLSRPSKWALKPDLNRNGGPVVSADVINPLRGYVSLPQVTFGPKRWQLPNSEGTVLASTANDLRQDKHTPINPEKLKAAAAGLSQIGSAFALATAIVFGGASLVFGLAASRFEVHNASDIRNKGKDLIQPRLEGLREHLAPLKSRAEAIAKKWHLEKEESLKERPLIKELSRTLGAKS